MSIILSIIILAILILVHEFGHFLIAKLFGIRVDEFGIGFPPKIFGKKIGETEYTLNVFPVGGFVRIFGETPDDESIKGSDSKRSFVNKPKYVQASVLVGGIFFNILFAWFVLSVIFMIGMPIPVDSVPSGRTLTDTSLTITEIAPASPAKKAGLKVGDIILSIGVGKNSVSSPSLSDVQKFIATNSEKSIDITYRHNKEPEKAISIRAVKGITNHPAIGIGMSEMGKLKLPASLAVVDGAKLTAKLTSATFFGLLSFLGGILSGNADLSSVSGVVGIVGSIGQASSVGLVNLLFLIALISISLAIINLLPFPALDGGRLFFLLIEKIKGSPIKPKIANTINAIGFVILILLMVVITYSDILKLIAG